MSNIERNRYRIPNLPAGKIVDEQGFPSADEQMFRQALITLLQNLFGEEGLVMPSQTTTDITTIQNNQETIPSGSSGTDITVNTCAFGTMIYDETTGQAKIAVEDPLTSGIPVFKVVTLT